MIKGGKKKKGREEKEEAEMNGNVAKDPISKSSSPDRGEEKEKLLTSLSQPAPVIVKVQKSSNSSSFRSR